MIESKNRPAFPKRAVVTAGMPYGDKNIHAGHVGGMFVHADVFSRFLRLRIGKENVIFVSGTDCYGAGPMLKYALDGEGEGLSGFVEKFHENQRKDLELMEISCDYFGASALYDAGKTHKEKSLEIFEKLRVGGYLRIIESAQFFDEQTGQILNGRQVIGRCPVSGCSSSKAYADECELGHQFSPKELIAPRIAQGVSAGLVPGRKNVKNWYFDLPRFRERLKKALLKIENDGSHRKFLIKNIKDFLKPPSIHIKLELYEENKDALSRLGIPFEVKLGANATLIFDELSQREIVCDALTKTSVRYRTSATLTPFRISGDLDWGVPLPDIDGVTNQTFYVWPESLWAPFSFVQYVLNKRKKDFSCYKKWFFDLDSKVYQFVGEDNVYFYAVAEMGLFLALLELEGVSEDEALEFLPKIIPNRHMLYGTRKAASSGELKPPLVKEMLNYYTTEQLRMHFAHMSLHSDAVSFKPEIIINSAKNSKSFDPVRAEGNILTNVFNRLCRSVFYTSQKYFNGRFQNAEVSALTLELSDKIILAYENLMYRQELSKIIDGLEIYIKEASKAWKANMSLADEADANNARRKQLADTLHVIRVLCPLLYPFAPKSIEVLIEYLKVDKSVLDWRYIGMPLSFFVSDDHVFKFLEPRFDFFKKHSSQLE